MHRFIFLVIISLASTFQVEGQMNIALVTTGNLDETRANISEERLTTSFELHRGKIIVAAELNGEAGQFLLDTGADALIINGIPNSNDDFEVQGLHESARAEAVTIDKMTWENHQFHKVNAFKVDLQELENRIGIKLSGIIGQSILGNGALHINYQEEIVSILPNIKPRALKKEGWKAYHLFQIEHLLAVGIKVNGKKIFMGLDTGAEINLIAEPSDFSLLPDKSLSIYGVTGGVNLAQQVKINSVKIDKSNIETGDIYYQPSDSFVEQFDGELSGLLGFPFFANNAFIIDMANEVLYLK